jgi:hypothetical protein
MSMFSATQVPPPKNWQDFESLCWDLWRRIWKDPGTQKNGRLGQPQCGVDVFGRRGDAQAGLQAKGKDNFTEQRVTVAELKAEVKKAKGFRPPLKEFILATTGPKDVAVEQTARELTERHQAAGLFSVAVLGWDDILLLLEDHPDVIAKFYPWVQAAAWQAEASRAAQYTHDHLFACHRGALLWCPHIAAVFGNDGYDPPSGRNVNDGNIRAREEVEQVREKLREAGIKELAFGKDSDGYSWAILVDSDDADGLFEMVWGCYPPGSSNNPSQKTEAFVKLRSYTRTPVKPHCCRG